MSKYVQHISGQGEKWKVVSEAFPTSSLEWKVCTKLMSGTHHWLPKSEYHLCAPPEPTWKDVTGECAIDESGGIYHKGRATMLNDAYRRRLVQLSGPFFRLVYAIVIEQAVYEE